MATKNGMNKWIDANGDVIVSAIRPDYDAYGPTRTAYNPRRVRGSCYSPYRGGSVWAMQANRDMATEAQSNFQRGKR